MEYEVVIDEEKLKSIINELNEKCSRVVKKDAKVTSSSIEEAMAKITSPNKTDISIKNILNALDLGDEYEFLTRFTKPQFVFEYEFNYRQAPYLAYLLTVILGSYHTNADMTRYLDELVDYENGEELNSYKKKMAEEGITQELYSEYELLYGLYQDVKECFRKKLKSEIIVYDDDNDLGKRLGK
jgi:hypothetical protein